MEVPFFCSFLFLVATIHALCPLGRYGNQECAFTCGRCGGSSSCDPDTGQCPSACQNGWQTVYCNISYPVLRDRPTLENRSDNSIVVSWPRWMSDTGIGQGKPILYVLQIKKLNGTQWKTVGTHGAENWSERNDGFHETVRELQPEVDYQVRVVVVDQSGITQWDDVPVLPISRLREPTTRDDKVDSKEVFRESWIDYLIWMGIVVGGAFVIALCIVLGVECRRRRRLNAQMNEDGMIELSENYINNSRLGIDNPALVTLRRDVVRDTSTTDKTPTSRNSRWKEAVPGLSRATAPDSWYTEWDHTSRIYENEYKT